MIGTYVRRMENGECTFELHKQVMPYTTRMSTVSRALLFVLIVFADISFAET